MCSKSGYIYTITICVFLCAAELLLFVVDDFCTANLVLFQITVTDNTAAMVSLTGRFRIEYTVQRFFSPFVSWSLLFDVVL